MEERYKLKVLLDLLLERRDEKTNEKEFLMLFRQNTGNFDEMYDLPGGHLEKDEDIFDGMIREAKEEIGIDLKREDMEIIHIYHRNKKGALKFVFKVKKYGGIIENAEPEICGELKWVKYKEIPENTVPSIKNELENIKKDIYYMKED